MGDLYMINKMKTKNYFLCIAIFVVGMFCVSIANIFGGFYCSVAVIEAILATVFAYDIFDNKDGFKENIISLIFVSIILFFGLLFFVVNDIFGVSVYTNGNLGFWGICVIISQLLSIAFVVYILVMFIMSLNQSRVEIIDDGENKKIDKEINKETRSNSSKTYDLHDDLSAQFEHKKINEKEEPKSIENNMKRNVPFMEEER